MTGQVAFSGRITFGDFSDISTITDIEGDLEVKWSSTISDLEGEFLAVAGNTLGVDPATGEISYDRAYGPCWEP